MESLANTFLKFGFSGSEANFNNALTYAIALGIAIGWLGLLSFSLASILDLSF